MGDQTPETSNSDLLATSTGGSKAITAPGTEDTLCVANVCQKLTYNGIHNICKEFGQISRIRLVYDNDSDSNRCYITYMTKEGAKSAYEAGETLGIRGPDSRIQLIKSANVLDTGNDYRPSDFEKRENTKKSRKTSTPRRCVGYCRNGRGNFIHPVRYLEKIKRLEEGSVKRYGEVS